MDRAGDRAETGPEKVPSVCVTGSLEMQYFILLLYYLCRQKLAFVNKLLKGKFMGSKPLRLAPGNPTTVSRWKTLHSKWAISSD